MNSMVTSMGSLRPGATYVYEHVNGVTYAREHGASPGDRFEVGRTFDHRTWDGRPLHDHIKEDKLWGQIRRASRTNPALQDALDRAIMIYKLTQTHE